MYETKIGTKQISKLDHYFFCVYLDGRLVGLSDTIYPSKGLAEQEATVYIESHDRACKRVQQVL